MTLASVGHGRPTADIERWVEAELSLAEQLDSDTVIVESASEVHPGALWIAVSYHPHSP